uniref:Putative secreted protein n=1 Tax=Ixodes scapularis TaxID=6945 RepID=A0A4D5RHW2_IXOSC
MLPLFLCMYLVYTNCYLCEARMIKVQAVLMLSNFLDFFLANVTFNEVSIFVQVLAERFYFLLYRGHVSSFGSVQKGQVSLYLFDSSCSRPLRENRLHRVPCFRRCPQACSDAALGKYSGGVFGAAALEILFIKNPEY